MKDALHNKRQLVYTYVANKTRQDLASLHILGVLFLPILVHFGSCRGCSIFGRNGTSGILHNIAKFGCLYSVDWTRDWTRDWTVELDSQKIALITLKHQNTTKYLHDMNGIRGSRP